MNFHMQNPTYTLYIKKSETQDKRVLGDGKEFGDRGYCFNNNS